MRLLSFSDLHLDVAAARRLAGVGLVSNVDFLVSSGDLGLDGHQEQAVYAAFAWAERPVLSVPGNHDGDVPYREAVSGASWKSIDGETLDHDGWIIAGWGVRRLDPWLSGPDRDAQREGPTLTWLTERLTSHPAHRVILVTHLPPSGTLASRDRKLIERGNCQLRGWIDAFQPAAVLCGHVHHREPIVERLGRTMVVNAGPHGYVLTL